MIVSDIVIGVISGIISSIIVTQAYRIKDRERDRQLFFEQLRLYSSQLSNLDCSDINGIIDFMSVNTFPKAQKWVKLTKKESHVLFKFNMMVIDFQDLVMKYMELDGNIFGKTFETGEREDIQAKILKAHVSIVIYHSEIMELGNPILQKYKKK